jgi:hypothetical protein
MDSPRSLSSQWECDSRNDSKEKPRRSGVLHLSKEGGSGGTMGFPCSLSSHWEWNSRSHPKEKPRRSGVSHFPRKGARGEPWVSPVRYPPIGNGIREAIQKKNPAVAGFLTFQGRGLGGNHGFPLLVILPLGMEFAKRITFPFHPSHPSHPCRHGHDRRRTLPSAFRPPSRRW